VYFGGFKVQEVDVQWTSCRGSCRTTSAFSFCGSRDKPSYHYFVTLTSPRTNITSSSCTMAYTDDAVKAKLASLTETQDSIVSVAQWIMFHRYARLLFLLQSLMAYNASRITVHPLTAIPTDDTPIAPLPSGSPDCRTPAPRNAST